MNEELQDELDQCTQEQHYHQGSITIKDIQMSSDSTLDQPSASHQSSSPLPQIAPAAQIHIAAISQRRGTDNKIQAKPLSNSEQRKQQRRSQQQPGATVLSSMNTLSSSAIESTALQLIPGMNGAATVPSQSEVQNNRTQSLVRDDVIFLRNNSLFQGVSQSQHLTQLSTIHSNQFKAGDRNNFEEEEVVTILPIYQNTLQIEEIIEVDENMNDENNFMQLQKSKSSRSQKNLNNNNNMENSMHMFYNDYLTEAAHFQESKMYSQVFQIDGSEHDIESQSPMIIHEGNEEQKYAMAQNDLSRQSSRMTRQAKEDPHIGQIPENDIKASKYVQLLNQQPLGYHSLDDQLLFRNMNDVVRSKMQSQSLADNLNQSSKVELNYSSQDNDQFMKDKNFNSNLEYEDDGAFDIFESANNQNQLILRDVEDECEEMNEEEKRYLLEVIDQDEEESKQARGRSSVLEEVEDDDIVNQNSSKSSSKERTPNKDASRLLDKSAKQQSFGETIQISNQNALEKKEEEKKITNNRQINSSMSSRTSTRPTRFTYFAASSLSDDRWLCPICLDIYEDAVETPCCHNLFCEKCIKKTATCPLCNQRIIGQLKPNIPIRRLVFELSINCYNQQCEEVIRKGEMDKHIKLCKYTPIMCPNNELCGKILRKDEDSHRHELCPYRIVECFLMCGLMLPLIDMEDHIKDECPKTQMQCKNHCGYIVERGEVERHINIDCPLEVIDCPNKGESLFEEGCTARLKRKEMETHKITCNFRRVYCQNQKCNSIIMYKDLHSHDERCLFKVIECDNKCGQKIQRQNMDKHKDVCEFQLVKCPYYNLGCKIEILRKDYKSHLLEEGFNHSIIFIEGQKKKNREIDELKHEIGHLRKEYDVEIKTMFLELNRVKEEIKNLKYKQPGAANQGNNNQNINSSNSNANFGKKDERRYEAPNFSVNSNSIYDYSQQVRDRGIAERNNQVQNIVVQNNQLRLLNGLENSQSVGIESNAASLAASIQSLGLSQNAHHQIYSSQQLRSMSSNPLNNLNNNQSHQHLQIQGANRAVYNKPPLIGRNNQQNNNVGQGVAGQHIGNTHNHNLFGENSNRGRIPILNSNNESSVGNLSERKNPMTVLLGSVNASQESLNNNQHHLRNQNFASSSVQARDFFQLVQLANQNNELQQNENRRIGQALVDRNQRQQNSNQRQRGGEPDSAGMGNNDQNHNFNPQHDLDSSNVLYDDDFEIEEEKHNF